MAEEVNIVSEGREEDVPKSMEIREISEIEMIEEICKNDKENDTYDIRVVDAICGSGKTTAAIEYMKRETDKQFIYVTPFLSEIDRVKKECSSRRFYDPQVWGTKMNSFLNLIEKSSNIATTHSLFKSLNSNAKEMLKAQNYVLILDEVMSVIEPIDITKNDLKIILDSSTKLAHIDEEMYLIWDDKTYNGKYNEIKQMCENKNLVVVNGTVLLWNFPVSIFSCFKEIWILTYLFKGQIQKSYFDSHKVSYHYYGVDDDMKNFIKGAHKSKIKYGNLINIFKGTLNFVGDGKFALSKKWFSDNKPQEEDDKNIVSILKKNIFNYFAVHTKTKSKENMWTTFKDYKSILKGSGYSKGFVSSNARATNDYRNKTSLAYCLNKYVNPFVKHFFDKKDVKFDEDAYALSELIQWIFRSRLRDKKPIKIYVPSQRMRELLIEWCKSN